MRNVVVIRNRTSMRNAVAIRNITPVGIAVVIRNRTCLLFPEYVVSSSLGLSIPDSPFVLL
jgi:hypothetical protein